jgi:hypothetical protein
LIAAEVASVRMPDGDPEDYVTPDLTVCPSRFLDSEERLVHPRDVALATEVVVDPARPQDVSSKIGWYATAAVRALLLIDPSEGIWALYTHPKGAAYLVTLHGEYGQEIPLPDPLGFPVPTDRLPLYGTGG